MSSGQFNERSVLDKHVLEYIRTYFKGVVHRDIKPANYLVNLDYFEPCLADFGLAEKKHWPNFFRYLAGSRGYVDPKACETKFINSSSQLDFHTAKATDTYALALTLMEILKGKVTNKIFNRIKRDWKIFS